MVKKPFSCLKLSDVAFITCWHFNINEHGHFHTHFTEPEIVLEPRGQIEHHNSAG